LFFEIPHLKRGNIQLMKVACKSNFFFFCQCFMLGASKQVGMGLSPKEIGVNLGSQIIHFICPDW
jgi:hypothetical protein